MSKHPSRDRRIARRVEHDLELERKRHDNRLKREVLDAVRAEIERSDKLPLSDARVMQVRAIIMAVYAVAGPTKRDAHGRFVKG